MADHSCNSPTSQAQSAASKRRTQNYEKTRLLRSSINPSYSKGPETEVSITEAAPAGGIFAYLLPEGSIASGSFNLASATLGAGALTLPYAFKEAGLGLGMFWLLAGMLATVFSIRLLIDVIEAVQFSPAWTGPRNLDSYEDLSLHLFGKWHERLVEGQIIIFCYGTAIAYVVAVGDIMDPVRKFDGLPSIFTSHYGRQFVMVLFWALLMLPLSFLKSVNSLRFSSFLGVASIIILVASTIYYCVSNRFDDWHYDCNTTDGDATPAPSALAAAMAEGLSNLYTAKETPQPDETCSREIVWIGDGYRAIIPVPLIVLAYTCQVNVFAVYEELADPSPKTMMKITWFSMAGICFMVYGFMGAFGYLAFLGNTESTVLNNLKDDISDAFIAAAFICIALTVVVAFPLDSIMNILYGPAGVESRKAVLNDAAENPDKYEVTSASSAHVYMPGPGAAGGLPRAYPKPPPYVHYGISFSLSASALLLALFIPQMQVVFSFLGGVCSSYLCFFLPAAFYKKMRAIEQEWFARYGYNVPSPNNASGEGDDEDPEGRNVHLWKEPGLRNDMLHNVGVEALYWTGIIGGIASTAVTIYQQIQ